jgi:SAM-dependent methyltransferase
MTAAEQPYDRWGARYSTTRHSDPSIARRVVQALGAARTVLNVGAGTGSYEPRDRRLVAVEPSAVMLAQRAVEAAPAIRAVAERLPFRTGAFDAAMAIFTIHHWSDVRQGLIEMRRVAKQRLIILTWEQTVNEKWWLPQQYFPGIRDIDRRRAVPLDLIADTLGAVNVLPVPVPHDCIDGFDLAFWRRPHAYLDPDVLASMSNFAALEEEQRALGMQRLSRDLADGTWDASFGHLLGLTEVDLGLRLVTHDIS